jgi:membrane-associated protease RseP (regulator of RpoE activity)
MPLWLAHIVIWTIGLMLFLFILNLGIGLFNLLPIFIADGARILFVTLKEVFSMSEGLATRITFMVGWVMLGALVALIFLPMTGILAMIAALG